MLSKHLDRNNLHHAYLIEGVREIIVPDILKFISKLGINVINNSDFCHITVDVFKIEDAENIRSLGIEKGFSVGKKIFIISANNFLPRAQNILLKMFEEPIQNTHFFLTTPDTNTLLKTFVSRFYLIKLNNKSKIESKDAEKFISISKKDRLEFIRQILAESDQESENLTVDSTRTKVLGFLNSIEFVLHKKLLEEKKLDIELFKHIFKVREFLREPGSSPKNLLESLALVIPTI